MLLGEEGMEEGETVAGNRVPRCHLRVVKVITHLHKESEKERKRRNDFECTFKSFVHACYWSVPPSLNL